MPSGIQTRFMTIALTGVLLIPGARAGAQVTPTSGFPPPDDTPSVRVGGTLFADYTRTFAPEVTDGNGDRVSTSAFNVLRTYINVTGQVNHLIAFRVTPDITRETGTGSSLNGSMTMRLKYGYAQFNFDDWLWRGTYARAGMIQTAYIDLEESIYRYRFQGPTFTDREGFVPSADLGASFRTLFPGGYGEVVGGVYNGEGYQRADPNDQKALQIRGTLRPFPQPGLAHGLRVTVFYNADHYVDDADRNRLVSLVTFEHRFLNAAWVHLEAADQTTRAAARVESRGDSIWITPRLPLGTVQPSAPRGQVRASLEGLFRYDRLEPDEREARVKQRWIAGVAYWPRMNVASVTAAFLLDYEHVRYEAFEPARPTERRIALHMLVGF
jgi:hypothetical protein